MVRFFTDLDNTMIFSHRHNISKDFRLIEMLHGKEQAFITKYTYSFLKNATWLELVPITTRTQVQYSRLGFIQNELGCKLALVGNGAVLLEEGMSNQQWYDESISICERAIPAVKRVTQIFENLMEEKHIHGEYPFFTYASSDNVESIYDILKKEIKADDIEIMVDRKKIFCIPKMLTKGNAIKRFHGKYGKLKTLTAGDSEFDYSMLEMGDFAFVPKHISDRIINENKIIIENSPVISDEICDKISLLYKKGLLDDK